VVRANGGWRLDLDSWALRADGHRPAARCARRTKRPGALGRLRGLFSLVGLGVSTVVFVGWLVPALLDGRPPVLAADVGGSAVMLKFVQSVFGGLDLRGLLLAGIVIGTLGILDDVTVTQVSAVHELRAADPFMPVRDLYRAGRDHVASLVNTLLLAYAGASLSLLVVFTPSGSGLVGTLTNGVVEEEIVRTLVSSIGLVTAVPLTTALAALTCPSSRAASDPAGSS